MRKLLAVLIALLFILIAVNILIVDHDRSRWGYQVGDYIEYQTPDGMRGSRETVIQIEPNWIVLRWEQWAPESQSETVIVKIEKFTSTPFNIAGYLFDPDPNISVTSAGNETINTRWGPLSCEVLIADSPLYGGHSVNWVHGGIIVKGQTQGGYLNITGDPLFLSYPWELTGLSPSMRYRFLGF